MTKNQIDQATIDAYAEDAASEVEGSDLLVKISNAADQLAVAKQKVLEAENALKKCQDVAKNLSEKIIPELMAKARQKTLLTTSGLQVTIIDKLRCSIPKGKEKPALDWLRKNGHSAVIKSSISADFKAGKDNIVKKLADDMKKFDLEPEIKSSVHPKTLEALLRELIQEGKDVPLEKFGGFQQTFTEIK